MKFEELYDEVVTSLGGEIMDVELSQKDVMLCFKKAKRTFQQKGHNSYRKAFFKLTVDPCQMSYKMPGDMNMVVKIIRPDNFFGSQDDFHVAVFNDLFGYTHRHVEMGDLLSFDLTMQVIENYKRYLAFDVMFHFDEVAKVITLNRAPRKQEVWLLEAYFDLTDEQYMDNLWIQNWTLAEAKIVLGNAYRKFSQIPGPEGSISLDGNGLIQEGKEEKERLLEDITNGTDGAIDYYPITIG